MRTRTRNPFLNVRTEGSILPADILARIIDRDKDLDGLTPESYHLAKNERINEVATRAWNRLQGAWGAFREAAERLPEGDLGTTLTRERWLQVLFQEMGYGRLMTRRAWELDGRTYPISHLWGSTPIHLVGCRVKMDTKQAGVAGAARVSPHSLVQEFLNKSDEHLWGIVSNGLILRLLRDNVSLTRQAYVEFDLEAMMEGEAFSDFVLLFMLCHQSRVEVPDDKTPESCWLEQWHNAAANQGIRALDDLRNGVKSAIDTIGAGFLAHAANTGLRGKLKDGTLSTQDYYRQILRVVYRLLFLFVAEDRDLLYDPDAQLENRKTYAAYYSTKRIRDLAERRRGTKHADLYCSLRLVFEKLREGCSELALPALGSFLFSDTATPDLDTVDLTNRDLLEAIRKLACTIEGSALRPIDYRNLGPEELGSVYESLLEMHPQVNTDAATFKLDVAAGSERKTTGSFYTHSSLVQCLLDSALDPVLDEAVKKPNPEAALLDLKICDPASGSGHFLIAAAHRVAKRVAAVRTGEDEPSPDATRSALRDVIGRCIYGVDINPMAVELCKISLWMEAMEPGKALGFLDHHIKCGNSLLGTTPALMANGIPNDALKPIEGDDKVVCRDLKAQNKGERAGLDMFSAITERQSRADLTEPFKQLVDEDDSSVDARERKAANYRTLVQSPEYVNAWFIADTWCAAFVLPKTSLKDLAVTHRRFRNWEANANSIKPEDRKEVQAISDEYQFFHWHLAFPEVFVGPIEGERPENKQHGWSDGFDCVLGNPPWERIKLQEKEFFASRSPEIAEAPNAAARRRLIASLEEKDPSLWDAFKAAKRKAEGESTLVRDSGKYPLCGRGDVNTYTIFAELKRGLISGAGRVGCIVPSGIATDDTTKYFFQDLMANASLVSLYDFENRNAIFPGVHRSYKFCLLTLTGAARPVRAGTDFVFFALDTSDLGDKERHFTLSANEIALLSPNTRTSPVFSSSKTASLVLAIAAAHAPLLSTMNSETAFEGFSLTRVFDLTLDRDVISEITECLPEECSALHEGKAGHLFNPRFSTWNGRAYEPCDALQLIDPYFRPKLKLSAPTAIAEERLQRRNPRCLSGLLCHRRVARNTDERTMVAAILPFTSTSYSWINTVGPSAIDLLLLCAIYNSFPFDFLLRQSLSQPSLPQSLVEEIRVPSRHDILSSPTCIRGLCLELSFTSWDLESYAIDSGYGGPPFIWNEHRRFLLRCELDAAFFHLYLGTPREWIERGSTELLEYFPTPRDAVQFIMETFPIVKRKDVAKYGEYRTKLQILDIYDRMQPAIDTGEPYQTLLDPPPGPPSDEHGNYLPLPEWKPGQPKPPNWPTHIHPPKEVSQS